MSISKKVATLTLLAAFALGLAACGKSVTAQRDELVKQWQAVADAGLKDPYKMANVQLAVSIADKLAALGPTGIDPLIDILADPQSDPRNKMLVTMSITRDLTPENLQRIATLTDAKYDVNTRVNAAHLIASFNDPALEKRGDELLNDPESRVRMAVYHMRLMRGDAAAIAGIDAAWADPATTPNDRSQLIFGIPAAEAPKHLKIYSDAIADTALLIAARNHAFQILAQFGDASTLAALEKTASEDPDGAMKAAAKAAHDALKTRLEGGAPAAPAAAAAPAEAPAAPAAPAPAPAPAQ